MPNHTARQRMIDNFQDSLRIVRHLMKFGVEEFADAIGVTRQTVNNLEKKKSRMSATQFIAIAALTDTFFAQNKRRLPALKAIVDGDETNPDFETSFRDDSLLKRWFEGFIDFGDDNDKNFAENEEDTLWTLAREYKIFLDAELLKTEDAETFVNELTTALASVREKAVMPLRSIQRLQAEATPKEFDQAMTFIHQMRMNKVLNVHGEETDSGFRDTILTVFRCFRNTYNLCLITPDEQLARDVLQLNDDDGLEIKAGFVAAGAVKFYDEEPQAVAAEESDPLTNPKDSFNGWDEI